MWITGTLFDVSSMRFQMNERILKIPQSSIIQKYIQKEMWSMMKQVYCGHKVISNDDMDFDDSKVLMIPKCTNDKR